MTTETKNSSKIGALWMKLPQPIRYGILSISAGVIQAISFTVLYELILRSDEAYWWACHLTALVLSVLWNFTLNRKYTFQAANNVPIAMLKVAAFYLVFTPTSMWLGQLAADAGWNGLLVEGLTMVANFVLEFLYFKFVVFREKK